MLEAFARRPEWRVVTVNCASEDVAPEARTTLLHWGEYERIRWDAVHKGVSPYIDPCSSKLRNICYLLCIPEKQS